MHHCSDYCDEYERYECRIEPSECAMLKHGGLNIDVGMLDDIEDFDGLSKLFAAAVLLIKKQKEKIAELEEKHWDECRQIAEYSAELAELKSKNAETVCVSVDPHDVDLSGFPMFGADDIYRVIFRCQAE